MLPRIINILKSDSFFLFGARGTGKTSLLRALIPAHSSLWIDLLEAQQERLFSDSPDRLSQQLDKLRPLPKWVVIDEVQKVPRLLDVVHREIESRKIKFALTGSSARKLRRGGANLLAGRAFVYHLYPLTARELGTAFDLEAVLKWGSLPRIMALDSDDRRRLFLESYVDTYLKEEVLIEQLLRNVVPFRKFLELAAQSNGAIINASNIAADIGVDPKTVRSYFQILEDTLLGIFLPATNRSVRKQQLQAPKFYLFDLGVKNALDGTITKARLSSQETGIAFEHFIICELHRLNSYLRSGFNFSYLHTKGGLEIDLIAEKPHLPPIFIEIKSTGNVQPHHLEHLKALKRDQPKIRAVCLCQERQERLVDGIEILNWQDGINEIFAGKKPA